jgi:hypothetical protein
MTCHEARELFSARVDDELSAADAARLDAHLAGCDDCRLEWARFERVVSLARAAEPPRAPEGFVDRVLEAARPVPWPVRVLRQVFTPLQVKLPLEVAALLLIGGLAVMIFQHSPEMGRMAAPTSTPEVGAPRSEDRLADRGARSESMTTAPSPPSEPTTPSAPAPPAAAPQTAAPQPAAPPSVAPPLAAEAPPSVTAAPPSVAQELRRDTADSTRRESVAKSAPAPRTAAPLAARARQSPSDVSAWLTVTDHPGALIRLAEIIVRFGGREQGRRAEGRTDIVDVAIPREAYDAFIAEVSRLGGFVAERPAELPPSVTISLRITH